MDIWQTGCFQQSVEIRQERRCVRSEIAINLLCVILDDRIDKVCSRTNHYVDILGKTSTPLRYGHSYLLPFDPSTITTRKRRVEANNEEVAPKKKKAAKPVEDDAALNKRKRRVDAADEETAPTKKKKKKKKVSGDECDDPSLSVKEKRRCQLKKK